MSTRPAYIYMPPYGPVQVLYHDAEIIVAVKPTGLLSVPGKGPAHADCLLARLQPAFPHARIVHRLDMSTSGIMVLAQTANARRALSRQFEMRQTHKTYIACLHGHLTETAGTITAPLICDWPNRPRQMVDFENGKACETHWRILKRGTDCTRVQLTPVTGRTHQLRVHMQYIGHAIIGDDLYFQNGSVPRAGRLYLHAETIEFIHPHTGKTCLFSAPCPF